MQHLPILCFVIFFVFFLLFLKSDICKLNALNLTELYNTCRINIWWWRHILIFFRCSFEIWNDTYCMWWIWQTLHWQRRKPEPPGWWIWSWWEVARSISSTGIVKCRETALLPIYPFPVSWLVHIQGKFRFSYFVYSRSPWYHN